MKQNYLPLRFASFNFFH